MALYGGGREFNLNAAQLRYGRRGNVEPALLEDVRNRYGKVVVANFDAAANETARLTALNDRFSLDRNSAPQINSVAGAPVLTVARAMESVASILSVREIPFMFDKNGYIAYQVRYANGSTSWSTNIKRLRAYLRTGNLPSVGYDKNFNMKPGPDITVGNGTLGTNVGKAIASWRAFDVISAWHKLLNATRSFSNKYAAQDPMVAYERLQVKGLKKLNAKMQKIAADPNYFQNAKLRAQNGAKRLLLNNLNRLNQLGQALGSGNAYADVDAYYRTFGPNSGVSDMRAGNGGGLVALAGGRMDESS